MVTIKRTDNQTLWSLNLAAQKNKRWTKTFLPVYDLIEIILKLEINNLGGMVSVKSKPNEPKNEDN